MEIFGSALCHSSNEETIHSLFITVIKSLSVKGDANQKRSCLVKIPRQAKYANQDLDSSRVTSVNNESSSAFVAL